MYIHLIYMSNPAELKRTISKLQDKLYKLCLLKEEKRKKEVLSALDFKYILPEVTNTHLEYIFK